MGGHLKNTVALFLGAAAEVGWGERSEDPPLLDEPAVAPAKKTHPAQVVMSAHVGDLDSRLGVEVFQRAADDLTEFFRLTPSAVVCDLHPDYASTRYAEQLAARWDAPLVRVQHHHAHVAACTAEHGLQGPVLGFSWDGTGYGPDGTVWGGEVLLCEGAEFQRAAHLRTFGLPGGDRAVREPRRSALGLLFEILGRRAAEHAAAWLRPAEIDALLSMLTRRVSTPRTSSMGRLFDAVAAICGLPPVISFEGQAAMALEFAAEESESGAYPFVLSTRRRGHSLVIDWEPLMHALLADRAAGVSVGRLSARFHNGLAEMAATVARAVAPAGLPSCLPAAVFKTRSWPSGLALDCRPPVFRCILIIKSRRVTAAWPWDRSFSPCDNCKDRSMCLGIPAKLLEVRRQDDLPMGKVEFGGIVKDVCLAYTPEAQSGRLRPGARRFCHQRHRRDRSPGDFQLPGRNRRRNGRGRCRRRGNDE